jgi:hypothetical protein
MQWDDLSKYMSKLGYKYNPAAFMWYKEDFDRISLDKNNSKPINIQCQTIFPFSISDKDLTTLKTEK